MRACCTETGAMNQPLIIGHRLLGVPQLQTPHQDARPDPGDIRLLVVHGISLPPGEFGSSHIQDLFLGRLDPDAHENFRDIAHLEVSAHLLIRRDGSLQQFAAFDRRAWHAGQSSFDGRERCNDFSVGIELEGTDDIPYETVQYQRLADISAALMNNYPAITIDRIVGHCDIAPGRKTDPGPSFDWIYFRQLLSKSVGGNVSGDDFSHVTG